ncbi:hypothetical protein [Burkholderia arboris]|uniref:hypothetical protein n=1 Tax=Burkholderia arboris TaxID=488730 RepID=UPI001CF24C75|nr:hypothetical protein [Burkholderia arboris]MCA8050887.1 hypothetical protein [Burkholderia arboris]CAJ6633770.1 Uncharacterised protein [Burkholderia pseudomallei]CAJ6698152.1 Uncharacterised protein [Burkholderia pseudomallei]
MQVLSWQHKRHRLVLALAKLDAQIASRAEVLEQTWVEKYRLTPHETGQTPPATVAMSAPPAADIPAAPSRAAEPPPAPKPTVPDYML